MKYKFITIEGNVGSGKTALATRISKDIRGKLILEKFENNPFLPKFYKDPRRHAFPVELFFTTERYKHLKKLLAEERTFKDFTVSDYLFTKSRLFAEINLDKDEVLLFKRLFHIINSHLPKPDLIVYLHNTTENLLENIKKRGRDYERQIAPAYLEKIHEAYMNFFEQQKDSPVVVLDVSKVDFVNNKNDYKKLMKVLDRKFSQGMTFLKV